MDPIIITEAIYPPKPESNKKEQAISKSFLSLIFFIVACFLFFELDIKSVVILTSALIIHEIGHLIAMKLYGYKDVNMFFVPLLGAYVSGSKQIISQKENSIILLAGPVPGIFIGFVLSIIAYKTNNSDLFTAADIFIYLNLFNLLPIMPLDGGKLIKTLFFEKNEIINTIFISISILIMIGLCFILKSYFLLVIPFLLIMQLVNQSQMKKVKQEISDLDIDLTKEYEELTDREYWMMRDSIGTNIKYYNKYIEPGKYTLSIYEEKIVIQISSFLQQHYKKDLKALPKFFVLSIALLCFVIPFLTAVIYQLYLYSALNSLFQ